MNVHVGKQLTTDAEDPFGELRRDHGVTIDGRVVGTGSGTSALAEALGTVWRRKWVFLLVTAALFAALAWLIVRLPSLHVAEAQVMISNEGALAIAPQTQGGSGTAEQVLGTQRQILRSRLLIHRVIDALPSEVAEDYARVSPPGLPDRAMALLTGLFGDAGDASEPVPSLVPEPGQAAVGATRESQYNRIVANMWIEVVPDTNVLSITFEDPRPEVAVFIVNEIARQYVRYVEERRTATGDESLNWIREEAETLRARVQEGEQRIADYRLTAAAGSAQVAGDFEGQIEEMGLELTRARQDVARLEALMAALDEGGAAALASGLPGSDLFSQILDGLAAREAELEVELASIAQTMGPGHPSYQVAQSALGQVRSSIGSEVARIRRGVETELAQARSTLAALQQEMAALTRSRAELASSELGIEDVERQVEADRESLEQLYLLSSQVNLAGTSRGIDAEILSQAVDVAGAPRPNKKVLVAGAVVLSGILGLAVAFFVDHFRRTVARSDHFAHLGFGRYVGEVSGFGAMSARRLVERLQRKPSKALTAAVEQAEQILLRLDAEHRQDDTLAVLVTSQERGEGKSTLAVLLAHAAARSGHRTLLLDLDLRASSLGPVWPNVSRAGIGAGDYAAEPSTMPTLGQTDTGLGFDYMGPGNCVGSPTGVIKRLIASPAFGALASRYEVLIIDSAPIGPVADSQPLIGIADCVVFSARAGQTTLASMAGLEHAIPQQGLHKLRFVLNDASSGRARAYRYG